MVEEIIRYRKEYPGQTTYHTMPLDNLEHLLPFLEKEYNRYNIEIDKISKTAVIGIHFKQK